MRVVETNNYDVLLPKEGAPDERSWRHQNHVGNSRFRIFIDMHARAYASAGNDENERDRIASTVVDTICHKCVPNGRFLELIGTAGAAAAEVGSDVPANEDAIVRLRRLSVNHGNVAGAEEWMDLGDGDAARRRTKEALAAAACALEQQSPPSPTTMQKGVTFSDAGAGGAVSTGGGGGEVTTKRHKRVGGILKNGTRGSPPDVNLADERFNLPQPEQQQGGGGRRARRKSSIIVSAFAAATGLLDAEETEVCECGVECTGACKDGANSAAKKNTNTKKRSRPSSPPRIVKEEDINNYDVLCSNRFGEGILPKSEKETIGNNRFRITVSLHRERYQRSDKRGKCKIVSEIMRGLRHCNPPGRFLTKVEDTPGLWKEVDKRTAFLTTIRTIRGSDPELKKLRNEAVESLKKRKEKQEAMSKLGKKSDHSGLIPEHQQQQQNLASPNSNAVLKMKRTHGRAA